MGKGVRRGRQDQPSVAVALVVAAAEADRREQLRALDRLLDAYPGGLTNEFDAEDFTNWVKRVRGES